MKDSVNFVNMVSTMKCANKGKYPAILFFLLLAFFLFPQEPNCEFYKYVDKNGKIHFVDSKTKIPRQYRKDLTSYKEKYDNLSEEERETRIAEDREKREEEREKKKALQQQQQEAWEKQKHHEQIAEQERQKAKQGEEMLRKALAERKAFLKNYETKVEIVGYGQALLPCILVYDGREVEAKLLLDTGCSITTIHEDVAKKLRMRGGQKGKATVAGGGKIFYKAQEIDYIKVGPHKIEDFVVMVIQNKNRRSSMQGLLGMNFLAGREYKLDYARKVIKWIPR